MPRAKRRESVEEKGGDPAETNQRPKRVRRPSWKALADNGSGSSVEAILPSYVSSGSSLRSLSGSGSGEENDMARTVPEAAGLRFQKQGSGETACPSKQGSNEPDTLATHKKNEMAGVAAADAGFSSLKDSLTNATLAAGEEKTVQRGIEKLKEYYGSHQQFYLEHMTHLINAMSHRAQQMVLNGDNLSSIKMQEALHAVATANAIIWRSTSTVQNGDAVGVDGPGMVDPLGAKEEGEAMMASPPVAVAAGTGLGTGVKLDGAGVTRHPLKG